MVLPTAFMRHPLLALVTLTCVAGCTTPSSTTAPNDGITAIVVMAPPSDTSEAETHVAAPVTVSSHTLTEPRARVAISPTPHNTPDSASGYTATTPLNLSQVVAQSLSDNPRVMADLQTFQAATEGQLRDRGRLLPEINLQGQVGRDWRTNSPQDPSSENWNRSGYNVQLRQLLYDGNLTRHTVRQLGLEKLAAYYKLLASVETVTRESAQAYIDLYRYRRLIDMAQENYTIHQRTLSLMQERLDSGVGKGVDTEQAAGRLALAQTNLMTENNNLNNAIQRYRRVVGNFPPETLAPIPDARLPETIDTSAFTRAIERNPDILSSQATVQAGQASTDAARGNFSPVVELRASSGMDRDNPTSSNYGAYNNRVEVVLNYNLYRGGADTARLRQTVAQTQSARSVRDYNCRNLQQELASTWNDIERLRAQLPFLRKHEAAMRKVSQGAEQQFQIGQRSLLDLLDTANELFDSQRARVNGEYDLTQLEYRWLSYTSTLLPQLGLARELSPAPGESSELALPESVVQACVTPPPDNTNLAPAALIYSKGDHPPTIEPIARRLEQSNRTLADPKEYR